MEKYKEKMLRLSSVLLALLMCVSFMPAGVYALDEDEEEEIVVEQYQEEQETSQEEPETEQEGLEASQEDNNDEPVEVVLESGEPESDELNAENETAECTHSALNRYPARKANCAKTGNYEYYQCKECGKKFLDSGCTKEATDAQIIIPIDPNAHSWDAGKVTKKATAASDGVYTYTCKNCGKTYSESFEYVEPINPGPQSKKFRLNGIAVQFKNKVVKTPDKALKNSVPGRVWVKGQKNSMQVNWVNPKNMNPVDGVIILRLTGSKGVYTEVARVSFKTYKNGVAVVNPKTSYTDKTAKKKNTKYVYRVISYFEEDDITYISNISKDDWAAGQLSTSTLKNAYTGKMSKKTVKLQSKGSVTLKVTLYSSKKKFMSSSRRWSTSNKSVAVVNSKGKITARAPGTATIRCRLASGYVVTSKVTVVGAYKPGTPKLKVDYATTSSITLIWNKVKNATSYDVYKSNDGLHWDKAKNTTKTTYTFSKLTKNHRYTLYVVARNDHKGLDKNGKAKTYTALGKNSNVLNQKAVVKRRPMTFSGWPSSKSPTTGSTVSVTIKINPPLGRKASLQMKSGNRWVSKKTITLPKGSSKKSVKITFPSDWWGTTSQWRLVIPPTVTTDGYTTGTLKITAKRRYQNPSKYVQITDTINKHGYNYYTSPVLVDGTSTKSDHIEAFIKTATKYKGDTYINNRTGAPGYGIDASGLVIQSCYGAGVDLWPIGPFTRPYNCVPSIKSSKLASVTYTEDRRNMTRGDLVFFRDSNGELVHVAIYLGNGSLLHASPITNKVQVDNIGSVTIKGYTVDSVRRIFN